MVCKSNVCYRNHAPSPTESLRITTGGGKRLVVSCRRTCQCLRSGLNEYFNTSLPRRVAVISSHHRSKLPFFSNQGVWLVGWCVIQQPTEQPSNKLEIERTSSSTTAADWVRQDGIKFPQGVVFTYKAHTIVEG